ncbi:hypothetical protein EYF80_032858 [Liparis tanakae]|uniref:Uncharacterized protein n=1 Tax=Liparis tanakae TaxID=230148 RepID=A0A4Z2GT92_9TELE|nr:hypothetical protein EYF80_032858 [Liparis tanakae]
MEEWRDGGMEVLLLLTGGEEAPSLSLPPVTLEPSARVPVCSCGAVNQTDPAKRERGTGTGPGKSTGKHSTVAEN